MANLVKNETTANGGARIYPNPVSNVLNAEFDSKTGGNTVITVFDASGNTVYNVQQQFIKGINRIQINFAGKTPGYYILSVTTKKEVRKFSVIKQ